jgi:hypothetical protein
MSRSRAIGTWRDSIPGRIFYGEPKFPRSSRGQPFAKGGSRAHPVPMESGCALDSLLAHILRRRTGVHFAGICASRASYSDSNIPIADSLPETFRLSANKAISGVAGYGTPTSVMMNGTELFETSTDPLGDRQLKLPPQSLVLWHWSRHPALPAANDPVAESWQPIQPSVNATRAAGRRCLLMYLFSFSVVDDGLV